MYTLRTTIAVVELVLVAVCKVLRVLLLRLRIISDEGPSSRKGVVVHLYLFIRHAITYTRVQLVERLPRELSIREVLRRLDGPLQCGCPHL